ncbi:MAG: hypothetical protein WGN25_04070 [Candidatus Electrothrix sp. GW3-4]|uniref:choice-of-anchor Y domain-containing protein n=1 Tax=Candidatus Electrothrix sp. GW3-4 TaxID=3126740 RepID=UPI0030D2109E
MIKKNYYTISRVISLLLFFPNLLLAEDFLLYDATVGQLPSEQPWLTYFTDGTAEQQVMTDGVWLQTSFTNRAGYSNYNVVTQALKNALYPSLDKGRGVVLQFGLQLSSENHDTADRAGFSVILLDSNHQGVELGFWANEIWAQTDNPLFTHGESVDFVTTGGMKSYLLCLTTDNYVLYEGNKQILTGPIRDYSSFSGYPDPYEIPSFLFLGDNTTSAGAEIVLGSVLLQSDTQLNLAFPWSLFLPSFTAGIQQGNGSTR